MKHKLFTLLLVLCACCSAQAQIKLQDSTVNVVAYFSKGDTLVYKYTHAKFGNQGSDTLFNMCSSVKFRLAVTEENEDGYKIEYTPLDFEFPDEKYLTDQGKVLVGMLKEEVKAWGDQKAVFVTDEQGKIIRIENYKEIQKKWRKMVSKLVPDMLKNPTFSSVFEKKDLKKLLLAHAATEQDVLNMYEEVIMLFQYHGLSFPMKVDSSAGEKMNYQIIAGRDVPDEYGTENDYVITIRQTSILNKEDIGEALDSSLSGLDDDLTKSVKSVAKQVSSLRAISVSHFKAWGDGWPKSLGITVGVMSPDILGATKITEYVFAEWLEFHKK